MSLDMKFIAGILAVGLVCVSVGVCYTTLHNDCNGNDDSDDRQIEDALWRFGGRIYYDYAGVGESSKTTSLYTVQAHQNVLITDEYVIIYQNAEITSDVIEQIIPKNAIHSIRIGT